MNNDIRKQIALLKYAIISPLVSGTYDERLSRSSFFLEASKKKYSNHEGKLVDFAPSTIERWYYDYKRGGFDSLIPKRRSDSGNQRKLNDDLRLSIRHIKSQFPRASATLIHQHLVTSGMITKKEVSVSTITRFINQLHLEENTNIQKDMRRFEHPSINELWYADTTHAFSLNDDGKKRKTYIIAFMDDKSRYITGVDVFFEDNFINVMRVMKSAVTQFGKPKMFTFDNGSAYKNHQMDLLMGRIGSVANYCAPYTPTSKGKIERWFRTMKDQFLAGIKPADMTSIDDFRKDLKQYVYRYNTTVHSVLKDTPKNVFFKEGLIIKRLSDTAIQKSFLLEFERRVSADNVIKIDQTEYEVPYRFSKQKILLRYAPDLSLVYVVDPDGQLERIKLLKKTDNAKIKREQFQFPGGDI